MKAVRLDGYKGSRAFFRIRATYLALLSVCCTCIRCGAFDNCHRSDVTCRLEHSAVSFTLQPKKLPTKSTYIWSSYCGITCKTRY